MKRYTIYREITEVKTRAYNQENLGQYCMLKEDGNPHYISHVSDIKLAREVLQNLPPYHEHYDWIFPYEVCTEYYIAEEEWDEDLEEWISTGDYDTYREGR